MTAEQYQAAILDRLDTGLFVLAIIGAYVLVCLGIITVRALRS